jgi:hypothetical protein
MQHEKVHKLDKEAVRLAKRPELDATLQGLRQERAEKV